MSPPIPEFLWLRDYEERLEFQTTTRRDRTAPPLPLLPPLPFPSIR